MMFWATVDTSLPLEVLEEPLGEWQQYYNWDRHHSALRVKPPLDHCCALLEKTPIARTRRLYARGGRAVVGAEYRLDLQQLKFKRSRRYTHVRDQKE